MSGDMKPTVLVEARHGALPFKKLIGVLKDLLMDVNIEFTPSHIRIAGMDPEKLTVTQLHILHLDHYSCVEEHVRVGINLQYLFKMLRGVTSNHTIELSVNRSTPTILNIHVANSDSNVSGFTSICTMDLPDEKIVMPNKPCESALIVDAKELLKAVREMSLMSRQITFGYGGDNLTLAATGNVGVARVTIGPSEGKLKWINRTLDADSAVYFTKFMEKMIRPDITDAIDIYFVKGSPLVFQFSDHDHLGVFEFALAPVPSIKSS